MGKTRCTKGRERKPLYHDSYYEYLSIISDYCGDFGNTYFERKRKWRILDIFLGYIIWLCINAGCRENKDSSIENGKEGIQDSLADVSKAQKLLNYSPDISVEVGLKITWDWFNN